MIRLVIVDDHALFREGLASIIQLEPDIEVSGLAGTVQEAVEVVRTLKPDIVLMDFSSQMVLGQMQPVWYSKSILIAKSFS